MMKLQFAPDWPVRCEFNFIVKVFHTIFSELRKGDWLIAARVLEPN